MSLTACLERVRLDDKFFFSERMQSLSKSCEKLDFLLLVLSSFLFKQNDYYHVSNKLKCLFFRSFQPLTN